MHERLAVVGKHLRTPAGPESEGSAAKTKEALEWERSRVKKALSDPSGFGQQSGRSSSLVKLDLSNFVHYVPKQKPQNLNVMEGVLEPGKKYIMD